MQRKVNPRRTRHHTRQHAFSPAITAARARLSADGRLVLLRFDLANHPSVAFAASVPELAAGYLAAEGASPLARRIEIGLSLCAAAGICNAPLGRELAHLFDSSGLLAYYAAILVEHLLLHGLGRHGLSVALGRVRSTASWGLGTGNRWRPDA